MAFIRKNINCRDWHPYTLITHDYERIIKAVTMLFLLLSFLYTAFLFIYEIYEIIK
jgi:hypothetical protein